MSKMRLSLILSIEVMLDRESSRLSSQACLSVIVLVVCKEPVEKIKFVDLLEGCHE